MLSKLFRKKVVVRKFSIRGPLENVDGKLMLMIPLAVGGGDLIECTKGIGAVEGHFLKIEVQPWMAEKLGVSEGTIMSVDTIDGEFRMQRAFEVEPIQPATDNSATSPLRA